MKPTARSVSNACCLATFFPQPLLPRPRTQPGNTRTHRSGPQWSRQSEYPILTLKGRPKALLDRTVAEIYGVETKRVNEAVKNNLDKFPPDFYFELTYDEIKTLNEVENFDLAWHGGHKPKAFTHLGCNMLATILKSEQAARRSVEIIRAFTALESSAPLVPQDPLELISLQARMISTLAEEMYKSRRQIENHDKKIYTIEHNLYSLDLRVSHLETTPIPLPGKRISSSQCSILRNLVKEKAQTKKQMIQLWFAFKKHFDVTRYVHLPQDKFEQARSWIQNYTPKN